MGGMMQFYLTSSTIMPEILKRTPRDPPKITPAKQRKIGLDINNGPCTSAQLPKTSSHQNLTLSDWMTVYSYVDLYPNVSQADIVWHFSTLATASGKTGNAIVHYLLLYTTIGHYLCPLLQ